jgi:hypothetical protein
MTACHIPLGTYTVYPGYWINYLMPKSDTEYFPLIFGKFYKK